MKKIVLLILVFALGLFLAGCFVTPDIKDVDVKVKEFKQDAFCGAKGNENVAIEVLNGVLPKCGPPPCPECDSCCPQCEECEECEICECPVCPEIQCPTCSPCCCGLTWGDLEVIFEVYNVGDDVTLGEVCLIIRFEYGTEKEIIVDIDEFLAAGAIKEYSVGVVLNSGKRVVHVDPKSNTFY